MSRVELLWLLYMDTKWPYSILAHMINDDPVSILATGVKVKILPRACLLLQLKLPTFLKNFLISVGDFSIDWDSLPTGVLLLDLYLFFVYLLRYYRCLEPCNSHVLLVNIFLSAYDSIFLLQTSHLNISNKPGLQKCIKFCQVACCHIGIESSLLASCAISKWRYWCTGPSLNLAHMLYHPALCLPS